MFKFHKIIVFPLLTAFVISTVGCMPGLTPPVTSSPISSTQTAASAGDGMQSEIPAVTSNSISSTQTPCPALTPIQVTPTLGNVDPKLLYILIDQSPNYQEYVPQALDIASTMLESSVHFGDLVIASYITSEELQSKGDLDKSIFIETQIQNPPSIPLTVTPHFQFQTSTPIPTITPYATGEYTMGQEKLWAQTATAIASQNLDQEIKELNQITCMHADWTQKVNNQIRNWEIERIDLLEESKNDLQDQITMQKQSIDTQGSFYYESFYYVAEIIKLRKEQQKFGKSAVIIFSNLNEFRPVPPAQYQNSFNGVDIIVPILYCKQQFNCRENTEGNWEKIFNNYYHPASINFIYLQSEDFLVEQLTNNLLEK